MTRTSIGGSQREIKEEKRSKSEGRGRESIVRVNIAREGKYNKGRQRAGYCRVI
jgi:hypothetical protein